MAPFSPYKLKLAAVYPRYSDDNSQPKSISDQARGALNRAKEQGRFIPWCYAFADYARSATYGIRQGYSSLLKVTQHKDHEIDTIYIDEFRRASRDDQEWWRFAGMCKNLGIRLFGASDGFHLDDDAWEERVGFYNLIVKMEAKAKRQAVRRGMRGAAQRSTCRGKLPLGFTKQAVRDESGRVARRVDGRPYNEPCIDPVTSRDRKLLYELFLDKGWSAYKIVKHFNALKVDGWDGWSETTIRSLLWSADAIGVFISNTTRKEYDYEKKEWGRKRNPKSEWDVVYKPELAIISVKRFSAARRKLYAQRASNPRTGKQPSRNQKCATTLFSGTLICKYCGKDLTLARSAKDCKYLYCANGPAGRHECKLKSTKSTRIVESCLLGYLTSALLTESALEALFTKANAFLAEEAARPQADVAPIRAELRRSEKTIEGLFARSERTNDEGLKDEYDRRIAQHRRAADKLRVRLRDLEVANRPTPPPLDRDHIPVYLSDIRTLLQQEIPVAAEAIRELTGPITIHQEAEPGRKRGAKWIATFQPSLVRFLRKIAKDRSYPDSLTLEILSTGNWITAEPVQVVIDQDPAKRGLAARAVELAKTHSQRTTAAALGVSVETVNNAVKVANGERPRKRAARRRASGQSHSKRVTYRDIASEVAHRYDHLGQSFRQIARELGVWPPMVQRAYDHAHPELVAQAIKTGKPVERARKSRLAPAKLARMEEMIRAGARTIDIVRELSCSKKTVLGVKKRLLT